MNKEYKIDTIKLQKIGIATKAILNFHKLAMGSIRDDDWDAYDSFKDSCKVAYKELKKTDSYYARIFMDLLVIDKKMRHSFKTDITG